MDKRDEEFLKRINETFRIEAAEHLNAFSAGLTDLGMKQSQDRYVVIIETMFREIHSLKGAARSVDQRNIESVCQPLESVFSALKRSEITLSQSLLNLFYKTVDNLSGLIKDSGKDQTVANRQEIKETISLLKDVISGTVIKPVIPHPEINTKKPDQESSGAETVDNVAVYEIHKDDIPILDDTVRIRTSKLDPLLLQAEEMIQTKKSMEQRINELHNICNDFDRSKVESQLVEFIRSMERDQYNLDSMVDNHLEAMRQVLMIPVSTITESFPRMVREISLDQKKEVDFVITGAELEIDKRILEEIKDPLIHLLRNSIDHGIGSPGDRASQNKSVRGTITLTFAARESGMIEIILSDNGRGINYEKLKNAAIKSGYLSTEAAGRLNNEEIIALIFQSGISTSSMITDLSGRGLGLSIVHEKIEKLNGKISVETEQNKGTTFHLILPMVLASFRGILVRVNESLFILPTLNVDRVIKESREDKKTVENHDTIIIDNNVISFVDLGDVLGVPVNKHLAYDKSMSGSETSDQIRIVVISSGDSRVAFRVDEVVNEQQVLVKSLGKLLKRVRNISGATILGSGRVVPVLQITDLLKSALKVPGKERKQVSLVKKVENSQKILVADDSITSRIMMKNILETAGFNVATAVDGTDAFTKACSGEFDLIVSDVDMPRMSGFELLVKIRHEKRIHEIPVVLVTALGSPEDRERGMEVGADAYIIKSSFDQTNLLEIIKKLI